MNTAVTKIIVHPGKAHRDEFLACGLAVAAGLVDPLQVTVARKDPTMEELRDPRTLVLDVGLRHDPDTRCFDHHQHGYADDCALSLLAKGLQYTGSSTYHDLLNEQDWYKATILMDTRGPAGTAEVLGLEKFPFELGSPIEEMLLVQFENAPTGMLTLIGGIVKRLITAAHTRRVAYEMLDEQHKVGTIDVANDAGGTTKLFYLHVPNYDKNPQYITQWATSKHYQFAFSVTPDDRGAGWALYRFDNHPNLDFAKIDGHPLVLFAHSGGFIAKTHNKVGLDDVLSLVQNSAR